MSAEKLEDLLPISPDHNRERLEALKQLCPDLFSNEGRLNVDELKKVVGPELVSETERYDFRWYGKTQSKRSAFSPSKAALFYDPVRSVDPEKANGNMIIEGENLEVLKLLTCSYRERIKMICIDPPYNTGKDFVYSDKYAEGEKPYWERTGVTQDGIKVDSNTESEGRFHSNWLSMMYSRLLVARYLLRPDGMIFVSIDDNEFHNLRRIMDEIFGEENFVDNIIWKKRYGGGAKEKYLVSLHEYALVYAREKESLPRLFIPLTEESIDRYYKLKDEKYETRGAYRTHPLEATKSMGERPNLVFPIPAPDGTEVLPKRQWLWQKERVANAIRNNELEFSKNKDGSFTVHTKQYLKDEHGNIRQSKAFSVIDDVFTQHGTNEIIDLFGDAQVFPFPKPTKLLERFLEVGLDSDDDHYVLDFFAGSGSLGHALISHNHKQQKSNHKFILVQLPELTDEKSGAFKAGFKRISDITVERLARVVKGLESAARDLLPQEREFCDSLGFKVYRLAKSNFPRVEFTPDPEKSLEENVELLKRYISEKEATFSIQFNKEDVFDEVLLKNGFMLDYALTKQSEFEENEVFLAKDNFKEALICLDPSIDPVTVDYFKAHKEHFFICLELALDTTRKWNLKHHLGEKLVAF